MLLLTMKSLRYHKQFYHGISSVSGQPFVKPLETRWVDQDLVEGLCHQCRQWVPVSNVKRKNSVLWYRHAHKVWENEYFNDHVRQGFSSSPSCLSSVMYTTSPKPVHPRSAKYGFPSSFLYHQLNPFHTAGFYMLHSQLPQPPSRHPCFIICTRKCHIVCLFIRIVAL